MNIAINCFNALNIIGMPEGRIPLAQATIYLACAPKSNSSYMAINSVLEYVNKINPQVPNYLKDKSYQSAVKLGHGVGYKYPHEYNFGYVAQNYLPLDFNEKKFYNPKNIGYEKNIKKYLDFIDVLKSKEDI